MSSNRVCAPPVFMRPSEKLGFKVDFTLYGISVDAAETITGTPTVTVSGGTAGTASANAASFENAKGGTCEIGHGVTFDYTAASTVGDYTVDIDALTTLGQQLKPRIPVYVR